MLANSSCYPGHNNQIGRYIHKRLDIKNITHQNNDKNGKKSHIISSYLLFLNGHLGPDQSNSTKYFLQKKISSIAKQENFFLFVGRCR